MIILLQFHVKKLQTYVNFRKKEDSNTICELRLKAHLEEGSGRRSLSPLPTPTIFSILYHIHITSLIKKNCIQTEDGHSSNGRNM